jgi:poly-gamma-glutamate capsule biosynthesis protein CapA/YwtB (metallophosphatase superfamily)
VRIGLLGDVMLGRGVAAELERRIPEDLWGPRLRELCGRLDLVVCNLECCLSDRGRPTQRIPGKPFHFRGPPAAVGALRAVGVAAVSLANNHALDFEIDALADTVAVLDAAGIAHAGAGEDVAAARHFAVAECDAGHVGVVAVTDHPREYAANSDAWGVAYADLAAGVPDWVRAQLAAARERCDAVIAFPHWGPNMTTRPAPWQRHAAGALRAAGADLVAGHSAHVFHGVAWDAGAPVLHDLGDALDDYRVDRKRRNDLGVLAVWTPGAEEDEVELCGLRLSYCRTDLAAGPDADWIAERLATACAELGTRVERRDEARFRVRPGYAP